MSTKKHSAIKRLFQLLPESVGNLFDANQRQASSLLRKALKQDESGYTLRAFDDALKAYKLAKPGSKLEDEALKEALGAPRHFLQTEYSPDFVSELSKSVLRAVDTKRSTLKLCA